MKKFFNYAAVAVAALSLAFTSCSDTEDPAKPLNVNKEQTATVKGKILINTNETTSKQTWSAPGDVVLIATVDYADLNSAAGSGKYLVTDIDIDPRGEFSFDVPVSVQGSVITVKFNDFNGSVLMANQENESDNKTYKVIWKSLDQKTDALYPGEVFNLEHWALDGAGFYILDPEAGNSTGIQ